MRKSVERRNREQAKPVKTSRLPHRVPLLVLTLLLIAASAGFIAWADNRQKSDARALAAEQTRKFAEIDKQVAAAIERKRAEARRIEAEAKAKAEAEARAQQEAEDAARAAAAKVATPATNVNCGVSDPSRITVIINKKHCFSPLDWAPGDLTIVDGFYLRSEAANQLQTMRNDAAAAGIAFEISSAYRSYAGQVSTYNHWVAVNGSAAAADTVSARPGYSEHQTGLVVDLKVGACVLDCFGGTAQYNWLVENAANYGFIQRYPAGLSAITGYSTESWHWRYVGAPTAQAMKANGIQTLEQYFGVDGGDYS